MPRIGLDEEYEVESILKERTRRARMDKKNVASNEYLVKWKGYTEEYNEWIKEADLKHCPELLRMFKNQQQKNVELKLNNSPEQDENRDVVKVRKRKRRSSTSDDDSLSKSSIMLAKKEPSPQANSPRKVVSNNNRTPKRKSSRVVAIDMNTAHNDSSSRQAVTPGPCHGISGNRKKLAVTSKSEIEKKQGPIRVTKPGMVDVHHASHIFKYQIVLSNDADHSKVQIISLSSSKFKSILSIGATIEPREHSTRSVSAWKL